MDIEPSQFGPPGAWFRMEHFQVTLRTLGAAARRRTRLALSHWRRRLIPCEARVAEQFQPMAVTLPRQQLRRALADTLRPLTPEQPPVVEEELQQRQVVRPQL